MCLRDDRDFGPKTDRLIETVFGLNAVSWDVWLDGVYKGIVSARDEAEAEMAALDAFITPEQDNNTLCVSVTVQRHIKEPRD